ncbi:Uma2 family endonuclease [Paludisphaera sp.]|uniref:Uma2 family endonuclease n=1 Tax=Paludisphaera sp. TaxID=2017432 RepID=UPI00301D504D
MPTTVERSRPAAGTRGAEGRIVLAGVSWDQYEALLDLFKDQPLRLSYDRGTLELMTPLSLHERYKMLIGRMIDVMTLEWGIRIVAAGSTTFRSEAVLRGIEPDQCYYLANAARVADWGRVDLDVDPPPDLAVEIDVTSDSAFRLGIHAGLKIPEVWRFDGEALRVLRLDGDAYRPVAASVVLPSAPIAEMTRFLMRYNMGDDTAWTREFRDWLLKTIPAPREG